jgi:hypothetical protein
MVMVVMGLLLLLLLLAIVCTPTAMATSVLPWLLQQGDGDLMGLGCDRYVQDRH